MPLGGLLTAGIGSAVAPAIGSLIGGALSQGDKDKQTALMQQALANLSGIPLPDVQSMKIDLTSPEIQGILQPEMAKIVQQGPSAMSGITTDPRLAQAQMSALNQLQQVGASGLRPQDISALNQVKTQVAQDENAREQATLQNMQQRGVAGSGDELAAKLASSQGAANTESQQGLNIAGLASQNALQAIMQGGQLGNQMQQTSFGQQAQQAAAADAIAKSNAQNAQQTGSQNTAVTNQAQAANLAEAQALANQKAQLANQSQIANAQLPQLAYQNALQKGQAQTGTLNGLAGLAGSQAAQTQTMGAGIGQAVGQAAAGVGSALTYQQLLDKISKGQQGSAAAPAAPVGSTPSLTNGALQYPTPFGQ